MVGLLTKLLTNEVCSFNNSTYVHAYTYVAKNMVNIKTKLMLYLLKNLPLNTRYELYGIFLILSKTTWLGFKTSMFLFSLKSVDFKLWIKFFNSFGVYPQGPSRAEVSCQTDFLMVTIIIKTRVRPMPLGTQVNSHPSWQHVYLPKNKIPTST
jgi:hypothetical protein